MQTEGLGVGEAFERVRDKGGYFDGWSPTFVGFFLWGGFGYSVTEFVRRFIFEVRRGEKEGAFSLCC